MLKKYLLNTSGNFGIMFALFSTVLVLSIGVAVDFAGMTKQRQALQNYIDAAVLAAVTSDTEDLDELQQIVDERIALLNVDGWNISAPIRFEGDDLVIDASSEYNTFLMGTAMQLLGQENDGKIDVGTSTASPLLKSIPINVALVLDTTDSMAGDNIIALRNAATALINDLEVLDSDVNISLVPFGQYVNILSQEGEPWLDTSLDNSTDNITNEPYTTRDTLTANICTPTGRIIPGKAKKVDGVIIGYDPDSPEQNCTGATYGPEYTAFQNYQIDYEWHGCAGSRDNGDNDKAAFDGVRIPGAMEITKSGDVNSVQSARCGEELIPLNDDFANLRSVIGTLTTSGDTYLPSGLMWGWRTLSPEVPFTEAAANPEGTVSAIIFMTDGFNTRSQNGVLHNGRTEDAGVTLGARLCENIKMDGIQMYTVAYDMPTIADAEPTKTMLRNCASDASSSYTPDNAAQLKSDFKEIGNKLKNVRLKYHPS